MLLLRMCLPPDTWHCWVICFQKIHVIIFQSKFSTDIRRIWLFSLVSLHIYLFSENLPFFYFSFFIWIYIAHIRKLKHASIFQLIHYKQGEFSLFIYLFGIKTTHCSSQEVPPWQDTCNATTMVTNSEILI